MMRLGRVVKKLLDNKTLSDDSFGGDGAELSSIPGRGDTVSVCCASASSEGESLEETGRHCSAAVVWRARSIRIGQDTNPCVAIFLGNIPK